MTMVPLTLQACTSQVQADKLAHHHESIEAKKDEYEQAKAKITDENSP